MSDENIARERAVQALRYCHDSGGNSCLWCDLRCARIGSNILTHCDDINCAECQVELAGWLADLIDGK